MQDSLMKKAAVYGALFFLVAMVSMFSIIIRTNKSVPDYDESVENEIEVETDLKDNRMSVLIPERNDQENQYFCVPIAISVDDEGFLVSNNYLEKHVTIEIEGMEADFYKNNNLYGNSTPIKKVTMQFESGNTILDLWLNDYYECDVFLKNSNLYLEFLKPKEKFEEIIVIEISQIEEKEELPFLISEKLKEQFVTSKAHVYYSDMIAEEAEKKKLITFANEIGCDIFLSIRTEKVEGEINRGIKCLYNPTYFIPFLGNQELADLLLRNITKNTLENANGLKKVQNEDASLSFAQCPASAIVIEYASQKQLEEMKASDEWLNQMAKGIATAVEEALKTEETK